MKLEKWYDLFDCCSVFLEELHDSGRIHIPNGTMECCLIDNFLIALNKNNVIKGKYSFKTREEENES